MSEFEPAFQYAMHWEDPRQTGEVTPDNGAKTRFGINSAYNTMPDEFWTMPARQAVILAKGRYLRSYFLPFRLDQITNQEVATYVFDCVINPGPSFVKDIQQAAANVSGKPLSGDYCIGPLTLAAINSCAAVALLKKICDARIQHYQLKSQPSDLPGLVRRAEGWQRLLNPVTDVDL